MYRLWKRAGARLDVKGRASYEAIFGVSHRQAAWDDGREKKMIYFFGRMPDQTVKDSTWK